MDEFYSLVKVLADGAYESAHAIKGETIGDYEKEDLFYKINFVKEHIESMMKQIPFPDSPKSILQISEYAMVLDLLLELDSYFERKVVFAEKRN